MVGLGCSWHHRTVPRERRQVSSGPKALCRDVTGTETVVCVLLQETSSW